MLIFTLSSNPLEDLLAPKSDYVLSYENRRAMENEGMDHYFVLPSRFKYATSQLLFRLGAPHGILQS